MKQRRLIVASLLACGMAGRAHADIPVSTELAQGIQAYQEERLKTALGHFIHALEADPSNHQAQTYVKLIAQKLQERQIRRAREEEVLILAATSKLMEDRHMDTRSVDRDLQQAVVTQKEREEADRHAKCTEAQMEAQLGRLCVANDLVLQVIAQDSSNREAQKLLSDLQSQIRRTLDSRKDLALPERFALEGFYAYGQADYTSAAAAWAQARSALDQSSSTEAAHQVALLHFDAYDQTARKHVEDERLALKARTLFTDGMESFEKHDFDKSLENFRQVALLNPDYPQLGAYLVQSEAAVERKRTSDMSDAKRQETAQAFAKGMGSLEQGNYADAKKSFEAVLALDPAHPQARLYLQQIETQNPRSTDPEAGKQHYEAGLIAFVAGEVEQAIREWHIALRFDPENPKVMGAINRAQRELNSSKELL